MNKQIRVFQIKEIHHKQRAKSYVQQIEDGFLIHHQNYQSAYKGQVGPSETPVTVRGRLEEQRPNTFIGRPFGVSDVMVWDEEEKRKFFYVDKDELVEFGGFTDIDSAGNVVALMVPNYQVDGKTGTWLPYDSEVVEGVCFFMMRNEQRRDAVSPIVVDSKGVFVTEAPNGFENVRATITEYVRRAERKQQDVTEHEKCLTNGTYERARESGTEQNYNMIDGQINNTPSVDELEEKAKRGEVISLSALAAAVKAEDGRTPQRDPDGKKPSIRAQLKADRAQSCKPQQREKEQEAKRSIRQALEME